MHRSLLLLRFVLLIGGLVMAPSLRAQQTPTPPQQPQDTLQQINPNVPYKNNPPAQATNVTQNEDLNGIEVVKEYPAPKTITATTTQNVFWTNNAFLSSSSKVASFGYNGRFGLTYVPWSTRDWTPYLQYEEELVRYDHSPILDFNGMTVKIGSEYAITRDRSWTLVNTYSLQQLSSDRYSFGDFYRESFFDNQVNYLHPLDKDGHVYALASYEIGWRLTEPSLYSRVDNALLFSAIYVPCETFHLQAYVRPAVYAYTDNRSPLDGSGILVDKDRTDFNISTGLIASYLPFEKLSLSANLGWTGNYSTVGARGYRSYSPSLSVSGSYGF